MLQLGSRAFSVEGVAVYGDHADPDQFWFIPAPVRIARRPPNDTPQLTLIEWAEDVEGAGVEGGGFLTLETEIVLPDDTRRAVLRECAKRGSGSPKLDPVQFEDGTVQCIALNLQGPGGTTVAPDAPGATFVQKILGASRPSLYGNEAAVFSLQLDKGGAVIMEQAFTQRGAPIGVIYDLTFTALRPALSVEITADFKRMYDSLKIGVDLGAAFPVGGLPIYVQAGIDLAFEKLKQDGAITIKVVNATADASNADQEKWALEFFKSSLLTDWFKPTLAPVVFPPNGGGIAIPGLGALPNPGALGGVVRPPASGSASGSTGGSTGSTGGSTGSTGSTGGSTSSTGGSTGSTGGSTGSTGGSTGSTGGSTGSTGSTGGSTGSTGGSGGGTSHPSGEHPAAGGGASPVTTPVTPAPAHPGGQETTADAVLGPVSVTPATDAGQYGVQLEHAAEPRVTVQFTGGTTQPTVRVNGAAQAVDADARVQVDVAAGAPAVGLEATFVVPAGVTEHRLYFDFELPQAQGSNFRLGPRCASYVANQPAPPDPAFSASDGAVEPGANGASAPRGAAGLREWLSHLPAGTPVTVDAYASYEGHPDRAQLSLELSERRLQVARAIIGTSATVSGGTFHGFGEAQQAGRVNDAHDRVAVVRTAAPATRTTTAATSVSRPGGGAPSTGGNTPSTTPGTGNTTPATHPSTTPGTGNTTPNTPPATHPSTTPATPPAGANTPGKVGLGLTFQLQKVEQEELKTLSFRYDRVDAVKQRVSPQGFLGLLAGELGPGHLIKIDLDDPFFREIAVDVDAPLDFAKIGLRSIDVQLLYGRASDPGGVKEHSASFTAPSTAPKRLTFPLNARRELGYEARIAYNFDAQSGWHAATNTYVPTPAVRTDRALHLNPFELLRFREIRVVAGDLDASAVTSVDVVLSYAPGGVLSAEDVFVLHPGDAEHIWRLRTLAGDFQMVHVGLTYHLVNGDVRPGAGIDTDDNLIAVNDPFPDALLIDLVPVFAAGAFKTVFADLVYEDGNNHYHREQRVEFDGADPKRTSVRIALFDPTKRDFTLHYSIVGTDNSIRRLDQTPDGERVFVGETF